MDTPRTPGVYALRHKTAGWLYIGSTANLYQREAYWMHRMRKGGCLPRTFAKVGPSCPVDWEFKVLQTFTDTTYAKLWEAERAAFLAISKAAPDRLLNKAVPPALTCKAADKQVSAKPATAYSRGKYFKTKVLDKQPYLFQLP